MERGKTSSSGRGGKSKAPQHPQDIFALGSKSTVAVSRDSEKRNIHSKPSTSGVDRKRDASSSFGAPPPGKRSRIGSPAESVSGTSLEVDPVDLVPHVLQALDTHNSDKLLGLLTGSIRLLKSQRSKPDPILCMSMLYLCKIRPNMFAHDTVTQSLCSLLKREQGTAFKSKGNPLVFVMACNMLYAGHRENKNWPDTFIKVYIEDALNERWWVDCSWCKCLVENIITAFNTKVPPPHLIPTDSTLGTMSPSGSGSPLMGNAEDEVDITDLEYTVFPRYSSSYENVEGLVLEAIKDQIQRRAAPDAIGKGFLKLLSATCGFPEIRIISAARLEGWLHSGKLWRAAQELLAHVCCNADVTGPTAQRDQEVLAQLVRMRLKTKPLVAAYVSCLREMVMESAALLRIVVTHTIYNELSNVRSPNNMAVLAALIQAQPQLVPQAMAETYLELLVRPEEYVRPLRVLTRECVRGARSDAAALVPLARTLATAPHHDPPPEVRERAFSSLAELFCVCCLVLASVHKAVAEWRAHVARVQGAAVTWLLDVAVPVYRPAPHDYLHALNKILFMESAESYSKVDNWPPESERAAIYRLCCELPLPQNTLLTIIFIGLAKEIPVSASEAFSLVEAVVKRAGALPPEEGALMVDTPDLADFLLQLTHYHPPDNIALPPGYTVPPLAISSLYWRAWCLLVVIAAHNPHGWSERSAAHYPTLRALIEYCITNKPSIEWTSSTADSEAERAGILQLETHLAAASNAKIPVTEHNCRLLSQLTTFDPTGAARRPPAAVLESIQQLSSSLRLGRLLCRQPALLLDLVERHGTRRAMPWLHHLLQHEQLELSVLPVQCVCELVCAGAGAESRGAELGAHLRGVVRGGRDGARAVLHHYLARLHHHHPPTRAHANRGLKLVLTQTDEGEIDYSEDVNPDTWLEALYTLPSWEAVREEAIVQLRAACLVETKPSHLAAYVRALSRHVQETDGPHTAIVLDLSQVVMERTSVMTAMLPHPDPHDVSHDLHLAAHLTLHALTLIFTTHIKKVRSMEPMEEEVSDEGEGEKITVRGGGRVHLVLAHACLKLLCYGPSLYDTGNELYNWLVSLWTGGEWLQSQEEAVLPDWLRLHLIRSARPPLMHAGLRGLPAHKLALFIQTFGMPVTSMTALLHALDACPAASVLRLGVERGYMSQLLQVQRARGATGGDAFAAALDLTNVTHPPDVDLFSPPARPKESGSVWSRPPPAAVSVRQTGPALQWVLYSAAPPAGVHDTLTQIYTKITQEAKAILKHGKAPTPFTDSAITCLKMSSNDISSLGAALMQRVAHAGPLLRTLLPHAQFPHGRDLVQISERLLSLYKGAVSPIVDILREMAPIPARSAQPDSQLPVLPSGATKEQLIAALESTTPNTLEETGNRMITTQNLDLVIDVITHILDKSQAGGYDVVVKAEAGEDVGEAVHVFGRRGRGCGLLLDWVAELLPEILGPKPEMQMNLMFRCGGAHWRPLLVTLLAHRASWTTLHTCLHTLLQPHGGWVPEWVVQFCVTLVGSPRVCQGRDPHTPRHHTPDDILALDYKQISVLVSYVIAEMRAAGDSAGAVCSRRLSLVVQCAPSPPALLAASLAPLREDTLDDAAHLFLLLLYMKVPVMSRLIRQWWRPEDASPQAARWSQWSPGVADAVSHTLLTALAHLARQENPSKEHLNKVSRVEAAARGWWVRGGRVGARGVRLVAGLVRAQPHPDHALGPLLALLEPLTDAALFDESHLDDLNDILSCYLNAIGQQTSSSNQHQQLLHRLAAVLRRYVAYKPNEALQLLNNYRDIILSTAALSPLLCVSGEGPPASWSPPPGPLAVLAARSAPPDVLLAALQEVEWWGSRRGGAWGGASGARAVLAAVGGLGAHPAPALRHAALLLLQRLLPALTDTTPGLRVVLECLESEQPEIAQSALDKLPELICGMQEHAVTILARVFVLGMKGRLTVEQALTKCVTTINMLRGC